jgi:Family of unknown function (DUF6290)
MKTLSFRASDDEAKLIRSLARQAGLSVSEFIRRQTISANEPEVAVTLVRCPITGAKIFGKLRGHAPLSTQMVKDLLSDFP